MSACSVTDTKVEADAGVIADDVADVSAGSCSEVGVVAAASAAVILVMIYFHIISFSFVC
jgi:hypothetical protein